MTFKMTKTGLFSIGKRLHISIFSIVVIIIFILCDIPSYTLLFLFTIFIHETSHIAAIMAFGGKIQRVCVFPFGIDIGADTSKMSYKKELLCTLSGSCVNLMLSLTGFAFMEHFPSPLLLFFIVCNMSLGLFNLLPLPFLDGGNALRLLLYDKLDMDTAFGITKIIDKLSLFLFSAACIVLISKADFNLSVIAVGIYGTISYLAKRFITSKKEKAA